MEKLIVADLIGEICQTKEQGSKLYRVIIGSSEELELDFDRVKVITIDFANYAIGHLLKHLTIDELRGWVTFSNVTDDKRAILDLVMTNAELYYRQVAQRHVIDRAIAKFLIMCKDDIELMADGQNK